MVFWIDTSSKLKLGIASRPRGGDWLQTDIGQLKREGVDVLVSLLTSEEVAELGLEHEEAECATAGISFHCFPIPRKQLRDAPSHIIAGHALAVRLFFSRL